MQPHEIEGVLEFLRSAEQLKQTYRTAWTSEGARESVAQHSWRLCLLALVVADHYPEVDAGRLLKICVVHDLGEAIRGDVPAVEQSEADDKSERERQDLAELLRPLPERTREEIAGLWEEYEAAETPEARLAKGLDKLETILQHIQGENPPDFDYRFNLEYGRTHTSGDPVLEAVRERLDEETARRAEGGSG